MRKSGTGFFCSDLDSGLMRRDNFSNVGARHRPPTPRWEKKNKHPMLIMEREAAQRAMRLLRTGKKLDLTARIDVASGGPYESYNVIGEIRGSEKPDEVVLIGAQMRSFGVWDGWVDGSRARKP